MPTNFAVVLLGSFAFLGIFSIIASIILDKDEPE